ncbi:Protein of unknown function (DUF2971) [Nitrosomonas oligotropha]|uniref:DUF2971 domain-containing protein n=2 Tax=Nitrosomonas oligotropha TaxID=42354 RepID=A0A2T5H0G4_9PROT|nr:Protein of unknown function (DUF2971) [Nitrosomonas oligotropha]
MLYHYTSLAGLIGVINNKSIWASHCEFLNDSNEFSHALSFAKGYSSNIFMEDDYLAVFGWVVRDSLEKMQKHDVFVCSFSEKPDLLSQWRGYCPQGSGICIGFDEDKIRQFCDKYGFKLEKCIYDIKAQETKILSYLNECLEKFPKPELTRAEYDALDTSGRCEHELRYRVLVETGTNKELAYGATSVFCENINDIAFLMKDYGFHEESEWRIICSNPSNKKEFRHSNSHIIPYITLPLIEEFKDSIKEIIIGPNPEKHRCKKSIEHLVESNGLESIEIKLSKIPFNSW